ncbi:Protein FAM107B [Frankliniella fusca]|uniref:Protein FAM107B n=1 Tax=Frankliniella fusca TaxID=407009 RepID=A0AAE1GZA9_9NEOP|nr:Protein FAM107B [Frankliniella fusca]
MSATYVTYLFKVSRARDQIESNLKASLDELRQRIGQRDPTNIFADAMIPEPEIMERCNQRNSSGHGLMGGLGGLGRPLPTGGPPHVDSEGLIVPRKVQNPCLDSKDRQNLHRELIFNTKIGKNPLNQKSELARALQNRKEIQAKKEVELQKQQNKSQLERVIEERARKLESRKEPEGRSSSVAEPEFMQIHAKVCKPK